jgi:hypothetical protein
LLFTSIGAIIIIVIIRYCTKPKIKGWQSVIYAFALLGGLVGILVGASKTPVVGTILPAILTFVTALLAYLFGKENLAQWRPVIPFCIIVMLITALYGSFMGSSMRKQHDDAEREYKEWLSHYEKVELEVAKNAYLRALKGEDINPVIWDTYLQRQKMQKEDDE